MYSLRVQAPKPLEAPCHWRPPAAEVLNLGYFPILGVLLRAIYNYIISIIQLLLSGGSIQPINPIWGSETSKENKLNIYIYIYIYIEQIFHLPQRNKEPHIAFNFFPRKYSAKQPLGHSMSVSGGALGGPS